MSGQHRSARCDAAAAKAFLSCKCEYTGPTLCHTPGKKAVLKLTSRKGAGFISPRRFENYRFRSAHRRPTRCSISETAWKPFVPYSQRASLVDLLLDSRQTSIGCRPRVTPRACLEGIIWVLQNGARWKDLPERYRSLRRGLRYDSWINKKSPEVRALRRGWPMVRSEGRPARRNATRYTIPAALSSSLANRRSSWLFDQGYYR